MNKFTVGDWVWSNLHQEPARIVSSETVWSKRNIQVWLPTSNKIGILSPEEVSDLEGHGVTTTTGLSYILSAAKIIDLLYSGTAIPPLEADILPLPHQLYAYKRVLSLKTVRYLLADEVGLGKTIEAGMMLSQLKKRGLVKRTLVVAPRGLTKQWVDEMQIRFNEHFRLIIPGDTVSLEEENVWRFSDQVVCSLDSVKPIKMRRGWTSERVEDYNRKRFHNLVEAGWDLIIIDEAHKLSGSTRGVARHALGVALSEAAPYLLLLSATPHQGKTEQFKRLMALIDSTVFEGVGWINREMVQPYVIRTEKRVAVDAEGKPLFTPRMTQLVAVKWKQEHEEQKQLYWEVTEYVRYGYNKALEEKRSYIGFLMVLMQRLISSSTRAIRTALERRQKVLETGPAIFESQTPLAELWAESTGQQRLDEMLARIGEVLRDERKEVNRLASLARRCELIRPDARAETLGELMHRLRAEEHNPNLKFLIFTEFVSTQEMLQEFLEIRGFRVVCLNGSMRLAERLDAQKKFSEQADILISTEAGGEGINLQFCHIVVNYDLPWNPMRLEQRIGRIDRIGQKQPVKVYNFVFDNTVEHRVREILEEKLKIILKEFGVDKLGDVLDADESESDFERLYRDAMLHPENIEENIDQYLSSIRRKYAQSLAEKDLILDEKRLDITEARELTNHPLPYWVEQMATSYIKSRGGKVSETPTGYELVWPDGTLMEKVSFHRDTVHHSNVLGLRNPKVKAILEGLTHQVTGMPIPKLKIKELPKEVSGLWSLWQITVSNQKKTVKKILPLFVHDDDRVTSSTAFQLWNHLLQETNESCFDGFISGTELPEIYNRLKSMAEEQGRDKLSQAEEMYQEYLDKEYAKNQSYYTLRRKAVSRLKDDNKDKRLKALELSRRNWKEKFEGTKKPYLDLKAVLILHVRGANG